MTDLRVKLGTLELANPIIVASGTFGSKDEYANFVDYNKLGAVTTKSITLEERVGNKPPRICETTAGMLNAIGLENKGVEHFVREIIPFYNQYKTKLIVSIAGSSVEEYGDIAKVLGKQSRVDAIEINISCPNVKKGGIAFIRDVQQSQAIVTLVRAHSSQPLFVKVSPECRDIHELVSAVIDAGCDGISLINTIKGLAIDIETRQPLLGNITGGLSGPAIKPIGLRYVYEVKQAFDVPIIAGGGIMNIYDALEFMIVGADAITFGTANFVNPRVSMDVLAGLEEYLKKKGIKSIREIVGTLKV